MYLVVIAWIYVALMVAVAEAASSNGTLLGAALTFVMWGLLPLSIVVYLMGSPARRRARRAEEAAEGASISAPDRGDHPAGDAVAPERIEP
jgi:membrane protein implicated in regulation of membrane protease activity